MRDFRRRQAQAGGAGLVLQEISPAFGQREEKRGADLPARYDKTRPAPNTPGLVQFIAPAGLTPGQWTVKLATQYMRSSNKFTTEVREDVYENPMTVTVA